MKDFDQWNGVKKTLEVFGVEQDGKGDDFMRLVVVLKKFSSQMVLVLPLTTKSHKGGWYLDLIVDGKDVQGILNQILPIDTKRLLSSIEQLSEKEVFKIIEAYYQLIKEK